MEILIGQIPEALYFALFMIYTKRLNKYRVIFTILMTLEYVLLLNTLPFSIWSHVLYFAISYVILKILYKEKVQITDIFTMGIASIVLMIVSAICYFVLSLFTTNMILGNIIQKIILLTLVLVFRHKLYDIQKLYKRLWNRNNKIPKRMKSITFRCINVVAFNIMFYLINIVMLFSLTWR